MKRVFYRIKTPELFADINAKTLEEAKNKLCEFGEVDDDSKYKAYWKRQRILSKIVKITEIEEEVEDE